MSSVQLVWFRDDLRLDDHPALTAAAASGPVVALYVLEEGLPGRQDLGGAVRWWLHHSLADLASRLAARGVSLLLRRGDPRGIVPDVAQAVKAGGVHWTRRYLPWTRDVDAAIKVGLKARGLAATSHTGSLLVEPKALKTGTGGPYKVFTPYSRALRPLADQAAASVLPEPPALTGAPLPAGLASDELADWALLPSRPDWSGGIARAWTPGEAGARDRLERFITGALRGYGEGRDFPARPGTSRLSPHLRFGEISPRRAWLAAAHAAAGNPALDADTAKFQAELAWREFASHLLFHFPTLPVANWKSSFDRFGWRDDPAGLKAWQTGQTGYPIVDAGMRELWTTGWMHNRVRMIVGSFLVKHLLIDWRLGEAWFRDTLVDADTANNAAGWQWIAGCGADAAPYFRIFNPVSQGERFDGAGAYVRRWVPEIARLPDSFLHKPWEAPPLILSAASIRLGITYPRPVVDHAHARQRALDTYAAIKADGQGE